MGRGDAASLRRGSLRAGQGWLVPPLAASDGPSLGVSGAALHGEGAAASAAAAASLVPLLQPFAGQRTLHEMVARRTVDGSVTGISLADDALVMGARRWLLAAEGSDGSAEELDDNSVAAELLGQLLRRYPTHDDGGFASLTRDEVTGRAIAGRVLGPVLSDLLRREAAEAEAVAEAEAEAEA